MKKIFHYMNNVFGIEEKVRNLTDKREKNCKIKFRLPYIPANENKAHAHIFQAID